MKRDFHNSIFGTALVVVAIVALCGCNQKRYHPSDWKSLSRSTTLPSGESRAGTTLPWTTLPGTTLPNQRWNGTTLPTGKNPSANWQGTTLPNGNKFRSGTTLPMFNTPGRLIPIKNRFGR